MVNSVGVPHSVDHAAQQNVERELSLEWRSARWRVFVPAGLSVVSFALSFMHMPVWLYEYFGAPGHGFGFLMSMFAAALTLVVAFRTAQARRLTRLEKVLIGGAVSWLLFAVVVTVSTILDW